MSVPYEKRLATKQDLADMYQGILPYLGGMPEMLANKFSKGDLYSTDEKMIGQWIDGKPLYQKSFYATNITLTGGTTEIGDLSGLSIDKAFIVDVFGMDSDYSYSTGYITAWIRLANNNIGLITTNGNILPMDYVAVTFQYTKTTDSAISIGSDTDYSTEEKIVGTWIDGSPIYQKTVDFGSDVEIDNVSMWTRTTISATSIDKYMFAIGINTVGAVFPLMASTQDGVVALQVCRDNAKANVRYCTIRYTKTTT